MLSAVICSGISAIELHKSNVRDWDINQRLEEPRSLNERAVYRMSKPSSALHRKNC